MDPRGAATAQTSQNFLLVTKDAMEDVALQLCLAGDKSALREEGPER